MSGERRQALRRVAHPGGRGRLRMPAMTISRRLALAAAGAVAIAVVLASFGAYFAVRSKLLDEVDSTLRQRARLIQRFAPSAAVDAHHVLQGRRPRLWPPPGGKVPPPPPTVSRFGGAAGVVQLVTPAGEALRPLGQKGAELPVDASTLAVARGNSPTTIQHETVDHSRLGVLTAPLAHGGAVEIALPLAQVESTLSGLIELLAAIAAGGVALAALLGLIVARTSLAPVRRFTTSTERIASGRGPPGARLSASAPDELGRLARSYNATLEALERSVIAQRQLVSDASHELRTPLASLRANLELMMSADDVSDEERREINADLVEQVDELTRLIEEIVELARSGEQPGPFVRVPLQGVVLAAVELVEPHAASVRFKLDLARAGTACGERHGLVVAVRNLLEERGEVEPTGRRRRGAGRGDERRGLRPRPRDRGRGPATRLRALLPGAWLTLDARLRAWARDRAAGRRRARRQGQRSECAGRRRRDEADPATRRSGTS